MGAKQKLNIALGGGREAGNRSRYKTGTLETQKKKNPFGTSVHVKAGHLSEKANAMEVGVEVDGE